MENRCQIIEDLMPLYLDDVCSTTSRLCVEEHIKECEKCREMLDELKIENSVETISFPSEENILKKTAWKINKWAIICAVGITLIVIYWLVYLWQDMLSMQGDYRYFSYNFHEIYTLGVGFVPVFTAIWFLIVLIQAIKNRDWRKKMVLVIVLALLLAWQGGYLWKQSQVLYTSTLAEVVEIPDENHIVIMQGERRVTLETTPMITSLLLQDGTMYGIDYESSQKQPDKGRLNGIWGTGNKE